MRKVLILSFLLISIMFIATEAQAYVFVEGWNISATPAIGTWWNATQLAWKYIPSVTYDLVRVEFYCGRADRSDVTIQLRQDASNDVGSVLSSGTFNHSAAYGWQGANITPYQINAGTPYWITMWPTEGLHANLTYDGGATIIPFRYDTTFNPDYYPIYYEGHAPMAKFYESNGVTPAIPEPLSMVLFGLGGLGFGIFRKKI